MKWECSPWKGACCSCLLCLSEQKQTLGLQKPHGFSDLPLCHLMLLSPHSTPGLTANPYKLLFPLALFKKNPFRTFEGIFWEPANTQEKPGKNWKKLEKQASFLCFHSRPLKSPALVTSKKDFVSRIWKLQPSWLIVFNCLLVSSSQSHKSALCQTEGVD